MQAAKLGPQLINGFTRALQDVKGVTAIRGLGLMIGIELDQPCNELPGKALAQGLLINVTAERVVRLLPPLIMTEKQADMLVEQVSSLIRSHLEG